MASLAVSLLPVTLRLPPRLLPLAVLLPRLLASLLILLTLSVLLVVPVPRPITTVIRSFLLVLPLFSLSVRLPVILRVSVRFRPPPRRPPVLRPVVVVVVSVVVLVRLRRLVLRLLCLMLLMVTALLWVWIALSRAMRCLLPLVGRRILGLGPTLPFLRPSMRRLSLRRSPRLRMLGLLVLPVLRSWSISLRSTSPSIMVLRFARFGRLLLFPFFLRLCLPFGRCAASSFFSLRRCCYVLSDSLAIVCPSVGV